MKDKVANNVDLKCFRKGQDAIHHEAFAIGSGDLRHAWPSDRNVVIKILKGELL